MSLQAQSKINCERPRQVIIRVHEFLTIFCLHFAFFAAFYLISTDRWTLRKENILGIFQQPMFRKPLFSQHFKETHSESFHIKQMENVLFMPNKNALNGLQIIPKSPIRRISHLGAIFMKIGNLFCKEKETVKKPDVVRILIQGP